MEYLPPRPLDAHNAFLLGQQIAHLHQWSDQPQFGLDFDNDLSTTPQPNAAAPLVNVFAEQRIGWQLELAAEKDCTSAISTTLSKVYSSGSAAISRSLLYYMATCGPGTAR